MDTTIRNLDERTYRELKARAALTGRTIGELVNEALRAHLARPDRLQGGASLAEPASERYPEGSERLSEEVDGVVHTVPLAALPVLGEPAPRAGVDLDDTSSLWEIE